MDHDETVPASVVAGGAAFRTAYLALRRQYAAQLPHKVQEARTALQACVDQPKDAAALEHLRRLAHTMAGTAPSIGFEAQGAQARRIEQAAHALMARPERSAGDFAPLGAMLDELAALGATR